MHKRSFWRVEYLANWPKIVFGVTLIRQAVAASKQSGYRLEYVAVFKFGGVTKLYLTAK